MSERVHHLVDLPQLAASAGEQARALGIDPRTTERLAALLPLLGGEAGPAGGHDRADGGCDPGALGELHQSLLDPDHRHRRGVHYTPRRVAATLVELALGAPERPIVPGTTLVADPSCGGGAFLLAVAEHLAGHGWSPAAVLGALRGLDIDAVAVEVTRTSLVLWAASAGLSGDGLVAVAATVVEHVVVGDALHTTWPGEGRLDAVLGNPPFGGQLAHDTARDAATAGRARELLGGAAGYADTAGLFLVRAVAAAAPGGRVVLLQPLSLLGARDAGAVRRRLEERAVLEQVWLPGERLFGAAVDVCAPVLHVADPLTAPAPEGPVLVRRGVGGAGPEAPTAASTTAASTASSTEVERDRLRAAGSWSPVLASANGVPGVELSGRPLLASRARATAGFRDEFYAIVPFVHDLADPDRPAGEAPPLPAGMARLVTAGLVEPGRTLWGRRRTRLAGRRFAAPAVDVEALRRHADGPDGDRRLAAWCEARLRPKVVVATQTKVVEVAVDDDGSWWPSVPVISVVLDPELDHHANRWLLAAALSAPPVSAWAAERSGGTALGAHALKLSARQVREVPLPVDRGAWVQGARALERVAGADDDDERVALLAEAGRLLTVAHALPEADGRAVLAWWADRAGCAGAI